MSENGKFWSVLWISLAIALVILISSVVWIDLRENQTFAKKGYVEKHITYCRQYSGRIIWIKEK